MQGRHFLPLAGMDHSGPASLLQDGVYTLSLPSCGEHVGVRYHQPSGAFLKLGLC